MGQGADDAVLYYAGLSAHEAGSAEEAAPLLRRALWTQPLHELAPRAKEAIGE